MHLFAVVLVSELPFVSSSLKLVLPVLFPCLLCVFFCDVFRILKVFLLHICSLFVVIVIQRTCIQVPPLTEVFKASQLNCFQGHSRNEKPGFLCCPSEEIVGETVCC